MCQSETERELGGRERKGLQALPEGDKEEHHEGEWGNEISPVSLCSFFTCPLIVFAGNKMIVQWSRLVVDFFLRCLFYILYLLKC